MKLKTKKMWRLLSGVFVCCLGVASETTSSLEKKASQKEVASVISLNQVREYVSDQQTLPYYYTTTVRNLSDNKPAYVTARVYRVNNPGEKQEDLTSIEALLGGEVSVIPNQIVIPAGGRRGVRVYLSNKVNRDKDQYYRIRFSPSPIKSEQSSSGKAAADKHDSSMYLGVGIGQILFISKSKPAYKSRVRVEKDKSTKWLVADNQGDSFLRVENMKFCYKKSAKKACTYFSSNHVVAGKHKSWPLDSSIKTIDFDLLEGGHKRKVHYDSEHPETVKIL